MSDIYYNSFDYASKAGEEEQYFESLTLNKDCARAIDKLIGENHDGTTFDYDIVVDKAVKEFGSERVAVVLAAQILEHGSWDGRYSDENKMWASSIKMPEKRDFANLTAHPVLIDRTVSELKDYILLRMKKYEFTDECITVDEHTLHRIRALKDFDDVKAGDLGGFIEKEDNLGQNAWVCGNAKVYGNASVYGNAKVGGDAKADEAWVFGNAHIFGNAHVYGRAQVHGNAKVFDNAQVCGLADIDDEAQIYGNAVVSVYGAIRDNAQVYGNALVRSEATILDNAKVYGDAIIGGNTVVRDNAQVCGNAEICEFNETVIGNDTLISETPSERLDDGFLKQMDILTDDLQIDDDFTSLDVGLVLDDASIDTLLKRAGIYEDIEYADIDEIIDSDAMVNAYLQADVENGKENLKLYIIFIDVHKGIDATFEETPHYPDSFSLEKEEVEALHNAFINAFGKTPAEYLEEKRAIEMENSTDNEQKAHQCVSKFEDVER